MKNYKITEVICSIGHYEQHGLYSSLELCCEGPWFTSIQEDGCDKGAHQSYPVRYKIQELRSCASGLAVKTLGW